MLPDVFLTKHILLLLRISESCILSMMVPKWKQNRYKSFINAGLGFIPYLVCLLNPNIKDLISK